MYDNYCCLCASPHKQLRATFRPVVAYVLEPRTRNLRPLKLSTQIALVAVKAKWCVRVKGVYK
jgi:hypothetical protein